MSDDEHLDLRKLLRERPADLLPGDPRTLEMLERLVGAGTGPQVGPTRGRRMLRGSEWTAAGERYEVRGELGRGGRGLVCLALDRSLGREVAIKTLIAPESVTPGQVRRFVSEARITAQLDHPSVVPVYEFGIGPEGDLYYTMRQLQGASLASVLRGLRKRDRATTEGYQLVRLLRIFASLCLTVAYAHDRRVVHRDIKPENVMVGAYGEVMLLDWGFALVIGSSATSPRGRIFGTPGYLAPERILREVEDDPRSDVYALGCVLYELLTWQRVLGEGSGPELLDRALRVDPEPPSGRTMGTPVPEDLEELCMACLARQPGDRPQTAREVADTVDAYLEGSRRREQVSRRVKKGRDALQRHRRLTGSARRARQLTGEIADRMEPWRPLEDKAALLRGLARVEELRGSAADAFTEAVACFESALSLDREDPDARSSMAHAYWLRYEEAERRNDAREMAAIERWLMTYDDGRYAARLRGEGALTLDTQPTHAEVICLRYERRDMMAMPLPFDDFGRTPLQVVTLPEGSYLLVVRAPGHRVTRYPLRVRRREHHHPAESLRLLPTGTVSDRFVHVPAGAFLYGGDPGSPGALAAREMVEDDFLIGRFPVTAGEYLAFIEELRQRDPDEALRRAPRQTGVPGALWQVEDGRWQLPRADRHGRRWLHSHPVYGVSWEDAVAYCEWLGARDGARYQLPTETQWEKAARGVDARFYPWGRWFDPSLCSMRDSQPGRPIHRPVGSYPHDASPFGVRDVSGGVQEWCRDRFDEDERERVLRGGSWLQAQRFCRLAHRQGELPWIAGLTAGFRVVRELDPAGASPTWSAIDL